MILFHLKIYSIGYRISMKVIERRTEHPIEMAKQNLVSGRKMSLRHVLTSGGPQVKVHKGQIRDSARKWIRKAGHNGTVLYYHYRI